MNLKTIKGVIQSHTKKPYESGKYGTQIGNTLTIDTGSEKVQVTKTTKPTTPFDLLPGTQVQVSFDAVTGISKAGKPYTINKIITDGLTILSSSTNSGLNGESSAGTTGASSSSSTAKVSTTLSSSSKGGYDANGARNGMITGKAVELAVARGEWTTDGLKQAAADVLALTFFVESGAKLEAKVKKPKEEKTTIGRITSTKSNVTEVSKLEELDNQDDSFEFEG